MTLHHHPAAGLLPTASGADRDVTPERYGRDMMHTVSPNAAVDSHAVDTNVLFPDEDAGSSRLLRRTFHAEARLLSPPQAATRWARTVLIPGKAVILDTETASMGGPIVEIAVVDAASGVPLLDTLVNPQTPIDPAAHAVHGISDAEVSVPGVPLWPEVYRQLADVTDGRIILAYNASYDRGVIEDDCARNGIEDASLADRDRWADVMAPRMAHARTMRYLRNGGGHRALGDVALTRQHLIDMAYTNPVLNKPSRPAPTDGGTDDA
jgi:DNA polymerase III subunit epsilon